MRWDVRFLAADGKALSRTALNKEFAIALACELLGKGENVLSIIDATGREAAIYGSEIKVVCASRRRFEA